MKSILSLPPELRDAIIDLVIQQYTTPSKDAFSDGIPRCPSAKNANLMYPALSPQQLYATYGLLLACRQLHFETENRIRSLGLPAKIDVMVVNRRDLWPTWISVPARKCKMVDVVVRLGETPERFVDGLFLHFGHGHHARMPVARTTTADLLRHVVDVCVDTAANAQSGTEAPDDEEHQALSPAANQSTANVRPTSPVIIKFHITAPSNIFSKPAHFSSHSLQVNADDRSLDTFHSLRCRIAWLTLQRQLEKQYGQTDETLRRTVGWFVLRCIWAALKSGGEEGDAGALEGRQVELSVVVDGEEAASWRSVSFPVHVE